MALASPQRLGMSHALLTSADMGPPSVFGMSKKETFSKSRKGFKEKLMETLSTAEAVSNTMGEANVPTKQSILIECLVDGNCQTFVDLFYLTAPEPRPSDEVLIAKGIDPERYEPGEEIPVESIPHIKDNLAAAEHAARAAELRIVYAAYKNVAQYFAQEGKSRKAIKFFLKCLDIAVTEEDWFLEMETSLSLGLAYEDILDTATAAEFYERHVELAQNAGYYHDAENGGAGRQHLIRVLVVRAKECESKGLDGTALLQRCLQVAKDGNILEAQGVAHQGLGAAYEQQGDLASAVHHYELFLDIALQTSNSKAQEAAYQALATVHEARGDMEAAAQALSKLMRVAQDSSDLAGQARAAAALGVIAQKRLAFLLAADHFKISFQAAQMLGDRKMLDVARANVGLARGAGAAKMLKDAIERGDVKGLLEWKVNRTPLGPMAGAGGATVLSPTTSRRPTEEAPAAGAEAGAAAEAVTDAPAVAQHHHQQHAEAAHPSEEAGARGGHAEAAGAGAAPEETAAERPASAGALEQPAAGPVGAEEAAPEEPTTSDAAHDHHHAEERHHPAEQQHHAAGDAVAAPVPQPPPGPLPTSSSRPHSAAGSVGAQSEKSEAALAADYVVDSALEAAVAEAGGEHLLLAGGAAAAGGEQEGAAAEEAEEAA